MWCTYFCCNTRSIWPWSSDTTRRMVPSRICNCVRGNSKFSSKSMSYNNLFSFPRLKSGCGMLECVMSPNIYLLLSMMDTSSKSIPIFFTTSVFTISASLVVSMSTFTRALGALHTPQRGFGDDGFSGYKSLGCRVTVLK